MKKSLINPERVKQYLLKIETDNDSDNKEKDLTIEANEMAVDAQLPTFAEEKQLISVNSVDASRIDGVTEADMSNMFDAQFLGHNAKPSLPNPI